MDRQRERTRPQVKDSLKPFKGRSRSAHSFKNSSLYEKFLFFENIKVSHNTPAKDNAKFGFAKDIDEDTLLASSSGRHFVGRSSACCVGDKRLRKKQSEISLHATSIRNRATNISASNEQLINSLTSSSIDSSTRYGQDHQSSQRYGQSHQRNIPPPLKGSDRTENIKSDQHLVYSDRHFSNTEINQPDSLSETSLVHCQTFKVTPSPSNQSPTSIFKETVQSIIHDSHKSALDFVSNNTLEDSHFLKEDVRNSKTSNEEGSRSQISEQTFDRYSRDNHLRRCVSTGALSELPNPTIKNEVFSYPSVLDPSPGYQSESLANCSPELMDTSVNNLEVISSRQISRASITLKKPVPASEKTTRKIHAIETRKYQPSTPKNASPRLNEWLSSVMKHQKEREQTEHWTFLEDEHSAITVQPSMHPPFSQDRNHVNPKETDCNTWTLHEDKHRASTIQTSFHTSFSQDRYHVNSKETDIIKPAHTLCLSKGINTDLSFSDTDINSPLTSNDLEIRLFSPFAPTIKGIEKQKNQEVGYGPPPSTRCSFCTPYHQDQHFYETHSRKEHQSFCNKTPELAVSAKSGFMDNEAQSSNPSFSNCSEGHVEQAMRKSYYRTRHSDSDFPGSAITIQVTKEKDNAQNPLQKYVGTYQRGNTLSQGSYPGFSHSTESGERTHIPKGVSPHYMFPCSHSTWEEDDVSRYLMSPRNSIGSICSVHSYKSSNADSAVDLGPPDDEQDFEFADFLARDHGRRLSYANENFPVIEKQNLDDPQVTNSFGISQTVYHASCYARPAAKGFHPTITSSFHRLNSQSLDYNPDELSFRGISHPSNRGTLADHNEPEKQVGIPDSVSRRQSLMETANFVNYDTSGKQSVGNDLKNSTFLERKQSLNTENIYENYQSFPQPNVLEKEVSLSFLPETDGDSGKHGNHQQVYQQHTYLETPQHPRVIPELVISDHSDMFNSRENSPTPSLEEQDLDIESPLTSRPTSSMSSSELDQLETEGRGFLRSPSVSSLCSIASTCSTCTTMSDTDPEAPVKKQSSWKKIRSFILWSPFVQVFKKHKYPWIQLAGHQGNFHAGEAGSVLKKLDTREQASFVKLMADTLKEFVPEYRGDVEKNGETYIQLQDLLCSFTHPCVMDVKMGVRTYLEDELQKARKSPTLRKDMYQKMIEIDSSAPTSEENEQKAVTKPRYMQWRDEMSSSVELGFRVEGIKKSDGNSSKDFKKTKTRDSIVDIMRSFVGVNETIVTKYISRLKELMNTQEISEFFQSHEIIGSSLLFVHDADENVGVWMIDFGKSQPLPNGVKIDHRSQWQEGNHEDGYLFGLDNLICVLEEVQTSLVSSLV